jgi:hypothetical protein
MVEKQQLTKSHTFACVSRATTSLLIASHLLLSFLFFSFFFLFFFSLSCIASLYYTCRSAEYRVHIGTFARFSSSFTWREHEWSLCVHLCVRFTICYYRSTNELIWIDNDAIRKNTADERWNFTMTIRMHSDNKRTTMKTNSILCRCLAWWVKLEDSLRIIIMMKQQQQTSPLSCLCVLEMWEKKREEQQQKVRARAHDRKRKTRPDKILKTAYSDKSSDDSIRDETQSHMFVVWKFIFCQNDRNHMRNFTHE